MKALILAAGYGTRLYPYTQNLPKPLIKVGGRHVIDYLVDKLEDVNGLSKLVVVTNARFFKHFCQWRKKLNTKFDVGIINDLTRSPQDRLGAVADMALAFRKEGMDEDFLVIGGDNFFHEPLTNFVGFAKERSPYISLGVFDTKSTKEARHYGVVKLSKSARVLSFQEKPEAPKSTLVAMCLYHFPIEKLGLINRYLRMHKHSRDTVGLYINWLTKEDRVYGFNFKVSWHDIGHFHTYKKLKQAI